MDDIELQAENVVITTSKFNPSILTQVWLVRNEILAEEDFIAGNFSPAGVQVQSRRFVMLAVPDFIQLVPTAPDPVGPDHVSPESVGDMVLRTVGRIVRALPHTPYTGIGINLTWTVTPDVEITALTRRLFFCAGSPIFSLFETEDAHFGGYLSKNYNGVRLKLDIKPIIWRKLSPNAPAHEPKLQFYFNFHRDLSPDDPPEVIESVLRLWDAAKKESERIMKEGLRPT